MRRNDWKDVFGTILGMNLEQFVESMETVGEDKTMERVYDYINKVDYNEEKHIREGSTH
jgi:hypothetical protein